MSNRAQLFERAKELGISSPYASGFMAYDEVNGHIVVDYAKTEKLLGVTRMANDAALTTTANAGVPAALVQFMDPAITEILLSAVNAKKLAPELKKGDWVDRYYRFPVAEYTGDVTPYSDHGENVASDVNAEYPERENFLFQTVIRYGDLEMATSARARLSLASEKQKAAAIVLNKAHNKFSLFGVAGKKTYGLLNDPNLPATISPATATIGGSTYTTWADKAANDPQGAANWIYSDVLKLYSALAAANGALIDTSTPIKLAVSNARVSYLSIPNQFGLTALKMLQDNFPALEIVQLPELSTASGEWALMIVPEVMGTPTAELGYSEKMRMGRVIAELSAFKQKAVGGSWGAIVKRPSLIKIMTGI